MIVNILRLLYIIYNILKIIYYSIISSFINFRIRNSTMGVPVGKKVCLKDNEFVIFCPRTVQEWVASTAPSMLLSYSRHGKTFSQKCA